MNFNELVKMFSFFLSCAKHTLISKIKGITATETTNMLSVMENCLQNMDIDPIIEPKKKSETKKKEFTIYVLRIRA